MRFSFKLLILISAFFCSCTEEPAEPLPTEPLPYTLTTNEGIVGKWLLVETYDNYNGNGWQKIEVKYAHFMEFSEDSIYIKESFLNEYLSTSCRGKYIMTDPDSVWLNSSCSTQPYKTKIDELSPTTLILSFLGRHGKVASKYRAIE